MTYETDQREVEVRTTELLEYQYEYQLSDDAWLLGDGGRGSGKTFTLCCKLASRAMHKGAREGLFRQKLIDLKATTLKTLLEGDGNNPPVLMPGSYTHLPAKKTIQIHNGGEIVYNGMDQGDSGREAGSTGRGSSLNLTGAAFDEWVEMQENTVLQVAMGVRVNVPGLPLQRYGVCNPSTPTHPLAVRFGIIDPATRHPKSRRIVMPALENFFNPPEFRDELRSLTGVAKMRYCDGLWVGADGLVYDRFLRTIHVVDWEKPAQFEKRQLLGVDDGYTDPFVVLDIGCGNDGRRWLRDEVYESKLTQPEKIERVKALWRGEGPVVVDNAAPDLIESMRREGINAIPCDKGQGSINYGINIVQSQLAALHEDGTPLLTISPNCVNTIREFESYEWKPGIGGVKDQPRDQHNHAMDALRYAVRYDTQERGAKILTPDAPEETDRSWSFQQMREADDEWGFE